MPVSSDPAWRVNGPSEDGIPGENVVFAVGVKRDYTGWIIAEMEFATDAASLSLTFSQLRGLRDALNNMLATIQQTDRQEDISTLKRAREIVNRYDVGGYGFDACDTLVGLDEVMSEIDSGREQGYCVSGDSSYRSIEVSP